jgi:hypothetical protein
MPRARASAYQGAIIHSKAFNVFRVSQGGRGTLEILFLPIVDRIGSCVNADAA